jgi:hypothetical protein
MSSIRIITKRSLTLLCHVYLRRKIAYFPSETWKAAKVSGTFKAVDKAIANSHHSRRFVFIEVQWKVLSSTQAERLSP